MAESMGEASTRLLREANDPIYARLSSLLTDRDIDAKASVLAAFFPDDSNSEFGIVVTPSRKVYEFDLIYGSGDLRNQVETAIIANWHDISESWQSGRSRRDVEDGMRLLEQGVVVVLPEPLQERVRTFGETHMAVHTVTVALHDGRVFNGVEVAWSREVIRVRGFTDVPFSAGDIATVDDESARE